MHAFGTALSGQQRQKFESQNTTLSNGSTMSEIPKFPPMSFYGTVIHCQIPVRYLGMCLPYESYGRVYRLCAGGLVRACCAIGNIAFV